MEVNIAAVGPNQGLAKVFVLESNLDHFDFDLMGSIFLVQSPVQSVAMQGTVPGPAPKRRRKLGAGSDNKDPKRKPQPDDVPESDAREDHHDPQEDNGRPKQPKKPKTDPAVKERLDKLENEKKLVLTREKWSGRLKATNIEVTESIAAAEQFEQTQEHPGLI